VQLQPCPGLADAIERGDAVDDLVVRLCSPLRKAGVDTVVLGCTHYRFVAGAIQAALGPQVRLIDTAQPVAERVAALWRGQGPTSLRVCTTGDASRVADVAGRLLGVAVPVEVIVA
jgi:glutamate racemase